MESSGVVNMKLGKQTDRELQWVDKVTSAKYQYIPPHQQNWSGIDINDRNCMLLEGRVYFKRNYEYSFYLLSSYSVDIHNMVENVVDAREEDEFARLVKIRLEDEYRNVLEYIYMSQYSDGDKRISNIIHIVLTKMIMIMWHRDIQQWISITFKQKEAEGGDLKYLFW